MRNFLNGWIQLISQFEFFGFKAFLVQVCDGTSSFKSNLTIPGKSVLTANTILRMRSSGKNVLFAFLSHQDKQHGTTIKVLRSLIFQALIGNAALQPIIHGAYISNYRQLTNDRDFIKDLVEKILKDAEPIFILIDGLDEEEEWERQFLLKSLLSIMEACKNIKLLFSSRMERDIAIVLGSKVTSVRIDHHNCKDIEAYIAKEADQWIPQLQELGADDYLCNDLRQTLMSISEKAKG